MKTLALPLLLAALLTGCASPILRAAANGDDAQVTDLLAHGANIEDKVLSGCGTYPQGLFGRHAGNETPLICAAINGRLETVKLLLAKGADVNAVDFTGNSALAYASSGPTANAAIAAVLRAKISGGRPVETAVAPPEAETEAKPTAQKQWYDK